MYDVDPESRAGQRRDWHADAKTPEHHVAHLLRVASPPPECMFDPERAAAWRANLRQIADAMWAEAWHVGVVWGIAHQVQNTRYVVVTEAEYERIKESGERLPTSLIERSVSVDEDEKRPAPPDPDWLQPKKQWR